MDDRLLGDDHRRPAHRLEYGLEVAAHAVEHGDPAVVIAEDRELPDRVVGVLDGPERAADSERDTRDDPVGDSRSTIGGEPVVVALPQGHVADRAAALPQNRACPIPLGEAVPGALREKHRQGRGDQHEPEYRPDALVEHTGERRHWDERYRLQTQKPHGHESVRQVGQQLKDGRRRAELCPV